MPGRTAQLQIRVTPEEKAALKRLAARVGQNVSTYVLSRALPAPDPLDRVLKELAEGRDPWDGAAELAGLISEQEPESAARLLEHVSLTGLTPLAQNLVAGLAEDVARAAGMGPPSWTIGVPPLPGPHFRWPLLSLRPEQLRRTRVALKRRNAFDSSLPPSPPVRPLDVPEEWASLADHLTSLELDVEFYLVGGAAFHEIFAAAPRSSRPSGVFDGPATDEVAKFAAQRGWAAAWLADRARELVGPGGPPGRFVDAPHLKIFAAPAEYVLALRLARGRSDPSTHDLEDLRFLLRALNLTSTDTALAVATRYVGQRQLPGHTHDILRRVLGG